MASKGTCKSVWLCATENRADICYGHYHTCYRASGHVGRHECSTGPGHHSDNRIGDVMSSVAAAYAAMWDLAAQGYTRYRGWAGRR